MGRPRKYLTPEDSRRARSAQQRQYRLANPERRAEVCRKSNAKHAVRKKESDTAWRRRNRVKLAAEANARYHADAERGRAIAYAWRGRNPGCHADGAKAWRAKYPEKARAWAEANKARRCENTVRRFAAELKATPAWADIDEMVKMYEARDAARELFGIDVQVDHVVPLRSNTVCGLHCHQNMQLLPAVVNASKSNRAWPDMW